MALLREVLWLCGEYADVTLSQKVVMILFHRNRMWNIKEVVL